MSGRNMNVYFKEEVFKLLKEEIPKRGISGFINESVMNNLLEQKKKREELQKEKIIAYYKKMSNNVSFQKDLTSLEDLALESLKNNVKK
jgi:hypothetical protein